MATLVKIRQVNPDGRIGEEFYFNVDSVVRIFKENGLYVVQDNDAWFRVDKKNFDIILNACNVVS